MDHVVNKIAAMTDGSIGVVINCFQFGFGNQRAVVGSRFVRASSESIDGLTDGEIVFVACARCRSVRVWVGEQETRLEPSDPRSELLIQILELSPGESWGKAMEAPARILGMINIHGAKYSREDTCFHCHNAPGPSC